MGAKSAFLPMSLPEVVAYGWDRLDVILVSGDAYVDHPAFGTAVIGRALQSAGFRVGIIAQPDWRDVADFRRLGPPRLYWGVSAGNLDSMVAHFTPAKKRRRQDACSPGGQAGKRPDRAAIVYAQRCRQAYGDVPIVLGGIEASLRRLAHYDYWQDRVRRSILLDAKADLLVYGNGEWQAVQIARRLAQGIPISALQDLHGTVVRVKQVPPGAVLLPSYEEVANDHRAFNRAFVLTRQSSQLLAQPSADVVVLQNPPHQYTTPELDWIMGLPYQRQPHPSYQQPIPALRPVQFSLQSHRGCFGGCAFCALTLHEGRQVVSRSPNAVLAEARRLVRLPAFRGTISNVGGPTANMYQMFCRRGGCQRPSCLVPRPCRHLQARHAPWLKLLSSLESLPGVKHVFIGSGIRHDLLLADHPSVLEQLCRRHVGGQLKVAPEHSVEHVLELMGKPPFRLFEQFQQGFRRVNQRLGKEQYLICYFLSSHPGCSLADMVSLAQVIQNLGYYPEQVQDFTPTPMTMSTAMYYTGRHPLTNRAVYVPRDLHTKNLQRALMQYADSANYYKVREALQRTGRGDLIGPQGLIPARPPRRIRRSKPRESPSRNRKP